MKKILIAFTLLIMSFTAGAQSEGPVKWSFSSRKKADKVYEVVLTATVAKPWHIYSQLTPDGGPLPTKVAFAPNPLLTMDGKAKETGSLKTRHDETFGVDVKYFADKVAFVQTIKIKSAVKTNIRGTIEYMVCNDSKCLPPVTRSFDLQLQ